ncbi:glycoside hydrolase family 13 protein [Entomospira culicis]|uniref:Alpha-glycosidase n=1 Tax=Entomospira culicis TaxID=2719989 RepID=A0A968KWC0_9SPIO|nr:glycoside hydrolase family 13 protein [Entomospira culicis]NIZ19874.1 alpha-glycosidase [Entomospira culicis]NIZ70088.1 alpha-glycosidase [Entomospira culicis]WDI37192.1 glycoside hydrolase family 13 protein [Entomospira culicis]WDI38821.1 glycoside hydrolase family 13 protein [Entomospira culicis]
MNLPAIYHRTSDNYCYPIDENQLIINLKTGYDVMSVELIYNDPFDGGILGGKWRWQGKRLAMPFKKELEQHIWWTTTITPEFKRCKYYFHLKFHDGQEICYLEEGFLSPAHIDDQATMKQMFTFPWLNASDIVRTPDWVHETVWYQIFPDRFANGANQHLAHIKPWHSGEVTNQEIYGGDLQGIIDKLDYLVNLGITGLYLNPIFHAQSTHKYDTTDYYTVDPMFGDNAKLKELVQKAHQKGLKVMLDGVFNHTGSEFFAWQDILKHGFDSPYIDWYMVNKFPFLEKGHRTRHGDYYSFAFVDNMPKINTNHPAVVQYFMEVVSYWVREFDIDALRLDVANEMAHSFNKELYRTLKAIKPDFYILGEIWHDSINWLQSNEFDSVMNYPLTSAISNFWLDHHRNKYQLSQQINRCYTMYMQQTNNTLFNLLDSHDTQRLFNRVHKNIDAFYQQIFLLFAMPGSPCIYYGTEIALEGEHDPDCRRCMPWQAIDNQEHQATLATIQAIIQLRHHNSCMKSQHFHFENHFYQVPRLIELLKIDDEGNKLRILFNASEHEIYIEVYETTFCHKYYNHQLSPGGILAYNVL